MRNNVLHQFHSPNASTPTGHLYDIREIGEEHDVPHISSLLQDVPLSEDLVRKWKGEEKLGKEDLEDGLVRSRWVSFFCLGYNLQIYLGHARNWRREEKKI
jgi:hypothetical protein